jgi:nucleoside-diphosphate-sugar epimerase
VSTVAVTGSRGFIGTRLVRHLAASGTRVHCLVRAESRGRGALPGAEAHVIPEAATDFAALLRRLSPTAVVNLASYGVAPSESDPETMLEANVGALTRLLAACAGAGARVVQAGSCSEYARVEKPALMTEDTPCHPSTPYGAAKLAATEWGRTLAERLGVPFVTLRLFGVYGPGESPHRIIPAVRARLALGEPVPLTHGRQERDFTFVDDLCDALARAVDADLPNGAVFNVCSGVGVSIREVCLGVCRALGASPELLRFGATELRPGEPLWMVGDPSRFQRATGWKPSTSLEAGIARTLGVPLGERS